MSTIHKLFSLLVERGTISVRSDSTRDHENLRVRLVKMYSRHRIILDSIGCDDESTVLSLAGTYSDVSKTSTFALRRGRRSGINNPIKEYEIVETT